MSALSALLLLAGCASDPVAPPPPLAGIEATAGDSLDALADAYRARLKARGDLRCTWQHDKATARCPDGRRHDLPALWAIVSADPDPAARADALLAMIEDPPPPTDFDAVAPFLHLRLAAPDLDPTTDLASLPVTPDSSLRWIVELGLPGGTVTVDTTTRAAWAVDDDAIIAAARAHVDAVDPAPFWPIGPGVARARVGDGHDTARLLSSALTALDFPAERAALVPDDALVVADAAHEAELRTLIARWQGPAPILLRRDDPGQPWQVWEP